MHQSEPKSKGNNKLTAIIIAAVICVLYALCFSFFISHSASRKNPVSIMEEVCSLVSVDDTKPKTVTVIYEDSGVLFTVVFPRENFSISYNDDYAGAIKIMTSTFKNGKKERAAIAYLATLTPEIDDDDDAAPVEEPAAVPQAVEAPAVEAPVEEQVIVEEPVAAEPPTEEQPVSMPIVFEPTAEETVPEVVFPEGTEAEETETY